MHRRSKHVMRQWLRKYRSSMHYSTIYYMKIVNKPIMICGNNYRENEFETRLEGHLSDSTSLWELWVIFRGSRDVFVCRLAACESKVLIYFASGFSFLYCLIPHGGLPPVVDGRKICYWSDVESLTDANVLECVKRALECRHFARIRESRMNCS